MNMALIVSTWSSSLYVSFFCYKKIDSNTSRYTRVTAKVVTNMPAIYKPREWVQAKIDELLRLNYSQAAYDNLSRTELGDIWDVFDTVTVQWSDLPLGSMIQRTLDEYDMDISILIAKLFWENISSNPNAIHLLEANMDKINWKELSRNSSAIHLLEANQDKIHWGELSRNPAAIHLLEANPDKIDWWYLSSNPNAIHLLEANQDKITWFFLSENPNAIHLLEANQDEIDWTWLSSNPNAIHLLEANQDKIFWEELSSNPNAIHLLEANPDKIDWKVLSLNPNAIHLLEANPDKIDWIEIIINPSIFILDYDAMKQATAQLHEELIAYVYHPTRVGIWVHKYGTDSEYLE